MNKLFNETAVENIAKTIRTNLGYSGKNLIPDDYTTQTIKGVTFTKNSDGTITASGTNDGTGNSQYFLQRTLTLEAGTYILNGCPNGGTATTYRIGIQDQSYNTLAVDIGSSATFTLSESKSLFVFIIVQNGLTASNLVFKPMISTSGGEYEPYSKYTISQMKDGVQTAIDKYLNACPTTNSTTGTCSNALDVPCKSFGVVGNATQNTTTGKNKANYKQATFSANKGTLTINGAVLTYNLTVLSGTGVGIIIPVDLVASSVYKLMITTSTGVIINNIRLSETNSWESDIQNIETGSSFTSTYNAKYMRIWVMNSIYGGVDTGSLSNIQIELGTSSTTFEPYTGGIASPNPSYPQEIEVVSGTITITQTNSDNTQSRTYTIDLGDNILAKVGSVADKLTIDYKGNVGITKNINDTTLSAGTHTLSDSKSNGNYMCTQQVSGTLTGNTITLQNGVSNADVYYQLASPTSVSLSSNQIVMFEGTNNFTITSTTGTPTFDITFISEGE